VTAKFKYRCDYCHTPFKTELGYTKHYCKTMKREDEFKSLEGQAAHLFYKEWMKKKHHALISNPDAFKQSHYFNSFMKFVKFIFKAEIPDTTIYIELMISKNIPPNLWPDDVVYGKYLEHITRKLPTEKLIEITIQTLYNIAEAAESDISEVFSVLIPNDVIQLLKQRRVSPWILLNSKKFIEFFLKTTTTEERVILESMINPEYWKKRFKAHPSEHNFALECIKELNI